MRYWQRRTASSVILWTLLVLSADARAGESDQPYPVGETSSTMGGAAVAVTHDGTAPWYNPAGLGRVTEEGISATLNVYGVQIERTKGWVDGLDLAGWTSAIFPGSVGYVRPLGVFGNGIHHAVGLALVVPDFARHELALDDTKWAGDDYHVRERLLEQTLWIVPGWGACFGPRLCAGASLQVGYWSSSGLYSDFEQWTADSTGPAGANSYVEQDEFWAIQAAMSVGAQYRASDKTWIGLSMRSPVITLGGGGRVLVMETDMDNGYIRRAYDGNLNIDQRLPLNLRLGGGLELPDWLLAADLSLSLPESTHQSVRAHDGSTSLTAYNASGAPIGAAIPIGVPQGRLTVVNLSIGAQYRLSAKTAFQAGFFTDFSGQPTALIDELHAHMNRYGMTVGISRKGSSSTTMLGIIATIGIGKSFGWTDQNQQVLRDAQSEAIYFTLGGSTRFGEPPEKPTATTAQPSGSAPALPVVEGAAAVPVSLGVPAAAAATPSAVAAPTTTPSSAAPAAARAAPAAKPSPPAKESRRQDSKKSTDAEWELH